MTDEVERLHARIEELEMQVHSLTRILAKSDIENAIAISQAGRIGIPKKLKAGPWTKKVGMDSLDW